MKVETERRLTVIKAPSIVKTFFVPIPLIQGQIAKKNAVATALRVIVIETIESAII
jgi:hypothetical protein